MNQRLAAADAALKAGRRDEAIDLLTAALTEQPDLQAGVYRALGMQLYSAGRHAEAETWTGRGVERFPRDAQLWNLRGVVLRNLKRYPEALAALDTALRILPKDVGAQMNRGNVLLDMGDAARAEAAFAKLSRLEPRNAEFHRLLGRSLSRQGKTDQALVRFRQATAVKKDSIEAWLDYLGLLMEQHQAQLGEEMVEKALAANPDHPRLLEAKAILLRRSGQLRRADAYLQELLQRYPDAAWLHFQLGGAISDYDRDRGNVHLRRAVELDPTKPDYLLALIESLERTRSGDEGGHIEEAYQLALKAVELPNLTSAHTKILNETFIRVCDFDALERLGSFRDLGRSWAETGRHTALLKQLARVKDHADRLELVEQHRIWGRNTEARARATPIRRPGKRAPGGKIRLGFMSSDLRRHPVGYFALPLFDHIDQERFEVFCYSFYQGREDALQTYIGEQVTAYRWMPESGSHAIAQAIADDDLDMLIELGGSTHMNKLEVMAFRPAPLQASWLGYPHSAGLATIDYLVCDPYCVPTDPALLVEKPLLMPHTWLALGRAVFADQHPITEGLPEDRNGFITFGTANNPHKYSREVLATWARVLMQTPGSRFAFIRPEGSSASFRRNIVAAFAAEGVTEDRLVFHTVRGRHMPFYNEVDITLDPFPLTGGTTTTESLWMGVPLVSRVGEAFFERLSYSILSNAGLGDLCARDEAEYLDIARRLVADQPRRRALRTSLREDIKKGPLDQTEAFARDFYDMVAKAVTERSIPARAAS